MWAAFRTVLAHTQLRIATITFFCMGFAYASTLPYQSIIGINELGMSEQAFGLLMLGTAVVGTLGAVVIGHFSDQARNRKQALLITLAVGALGFGQFFLFTNLFTYLLLLLVLFPIASSASSQIYAVIRSVTRDWGAGEAASINSIIRTIFAGSWIVVPGLVGAFIAWTGRAADAFGIAALAYLLSLTIYAIWGPKGGRAEAPEHGRWASLIEAVRLILSGRIMVRMFALAMIGIAYPVNATLLPLIVVGEHGGSTSDVGILAGLVAALEIPFMLLGGSMARRLPVWMIVSVGGVVHAIYLIALGLAWSLEVIYGLAILNAAAAAIVLSIHISYLQEMMPDRPGLGTSLYSVEMLIMRSVGAFIIAGVGLVFSLTGALLLAGAVSLMGSGLIVALDRRR